MLATRENLGYDTRGGHNHSVSLMDLAGRHTHQGSQYITPSGMRGSSRKILHQNAANTRSKHQLNKYRSTVNTNRGVEVAIDPAGKQPES